MSISSDYSAKRSAAEDLEHCTAGRASQTKKQKVYVEEVKDEEPTPTDTVDIKVDPPVEIAIPCEPSPSTSTALVTVTAPPPPPRSPSPPRFLQSRPAIPSPLCNCSLSHCTSTTCSPPMASSPLPTPPPPPPAPRRRRSNEIALLKFALDPWLRLSRSMANNNASGPVNSFCKSPTSPPTPFNPATYPSAGNLRELRRWNVAPQSSQWDISFGFQTTPEVVGLGFGGMESVSWNLVGA